MGKKSQAVDAYIEKAPEFARPILKRLRQQMHKGAPGIEEGIKWSQPAFLGKGIVTGMAAFKNHVTFGFWKGKLMTDPEGLFEGAGRTSITTLKLTSPKDLPPEKVMLSYIEEAMKLDAEGAKTRPAARKKKPVAPAKPPADLLAALKKKKKALATFEGFSPSHRKEYVEWIVEAKREETRKKRIATAVEWMSEGKPRHWKYMKK